MARASSASDERTRGSDARFHLLPELTGPIPYLHRILANSLRSAHAPKTPNATKLNPKNADL